MTGSGPAFKRWKCILCGDDVIEGQRFIFVPRKGFAHLECVISRAAAAGAIDRDIAALLDSVEAVSYAIVRLKGSQRAVNDGKLYDEIDQARKKVEGIAARLEAILAEELARRGVEL